MRIRQLTPLEQHEQARRIKETEAMLAASNGSDFEAEAWAAAPWNQPPKSCPCPKCKTEMREESDGTPEHDNWMECPKCGTTKEI